MRQISIIVIVDVLEALTTDTLDGNVYLVDNNKSGGSINEGTEKLQSAAQVGDTISWLISGLEVETKVSIRDITGPAKDVCNPQKTEDGDLWLGKVIDCSSRNYPYTLELKVENKIMTMSPGTSLAVM